MAKRIKVKGKTPRGLSKSQRRKIAPFQQKRNKLIAEKERPVDPSDIDAIGIRVTKRNRRKDSIARLDYNIDKIAERPDISHGSSSTRKKLVKEGNRKFVGPRQFSSELREDRGRRSTRVDRLFNRSMTREYLEQDDPTVDVGPIGEGFVGKLRGGLSPAVVARLKKALREIAAKPQSAMTAKELKFLSTVDATGRFLGNYPGISRV